MGRDPAPLSERRGHGEDDDDGPGQAHGVTGDLDHPPPGQISTNSRSL